MNELLKAIAELQSRNDRDKEDDYYLCYLQEEEERLRPNASKEEIDEAMFVAGYKAMMRNNLDEVNECQSAKSN